MLIIVHPTGRAQFGLGLGVLPPASAITSVLVTPPVVSHIVAVAAGGARSSGTGGPPPLAALLFLGPPLLSVTLQVWSSQSTLASSAISLRLQCKVSLTHHA